MFFSLKNKYFSRSLACISILVAFNGKSFGQEESKIVSSKSDHAVVTSMSLTKNKGGVQYTVEINESGKYYIGAVTRGVEGSKINVLIDSRSVIGCIKLSSNGWQSTIVSNPVNNSETSYHLSKGTHTITFVQKTNIVPLIDKIILTKSLADMNLSASELVKYEKQVSNSHLPVSYKKESIESQVKAIAPATDPLYDFSCQNDISASYTYWQWYWGNAGETVTWETRKSDPWGSDPVMYLFRLDGNNVVESWADDDGNGGRQSKITVTLPASGYYQLVVRSYSSYYPGTSDLYLNGTLQQSDITLAGKMVYIGYSSKSSEVNYFTSYEGSGPWDFDTKLYIMNNYVSPIVAQNDDYYGTGDFYWGYKSRIKHASPNITYALVIKYSAGTVNCDLYAQCSPSTIMPYFPALKADDAIMSSSESSAYNCISWSGGRTDLGRYFWPPDQYCPNNVWYDTRGAKQSFDNFYGNVNQYGSPTPRFDNAMTFVPTYNSNESVVDLWSYTQTPPYNYTHGSVKKPGDNFYHGYEWESKPGGLMRTFHPRFALGANGQGSGYGYVVEYYKPSSLMKSTVGVLGSKSVRTDVVGKSERDRISASKNTLSASLVNQFEKAYQTWKATWNGASLIYESNPEAFLKTKEYSQLSSILNMDKKGSAALLVEKLLNGDELAGYALCKEGLLENSDKVMDLTRSTSPHGKISSDGYLIIDTPENAWARFAKNIIATNF